MMDNATAQLAIAFQLRDLDDLEASGSIDKVVADFQREQLRNDASFDAVAFETSRRLAISMAKAVEEDSQVVAELTLENTNAFRDRGLALNLAGTPAPPIAALENIDNEIMERFAALNRPPPQSCQDELSEPELTASNSPHEVVVPENGEEGILDLVIAGSVSSDPPIAEIRSEECSESQSEASHDVSQTSSSSHLAHLTEELDAIEVGSESGGLFHDDGASSRSSSLTSARVGDFDHGIVGPLSTTTTNVQMPQETTGTLADSETAPSSTECTSCSDTFPTSELVKPSCEHYYCKECFRYFYK